MRIKVLFQYSPEEQGENDPSFVSNEDGRWDDFERDINDEISSIMEFNFPNKEFSVSFDYA